MPNYFTCKCRLCNCRASVACTIWSNYNYGHNFVIHLICWVLEGRHLLLPSFLSRFFWPKKLYKHHGQYIILFLSNCSSSAHAAALIFPCFIFFQNWKKIETWNFMIFLENLIFYSFRIFWKLWFFQFLEKLKTVLKKTQEKWGKFSKLSKNNSNSSYTVVGHKL